MLQAASILYLLATALYAAATVLYAYYFVEKRRPLSVAATFVTGAGFVVLTASIGLRSQAMHTTRMTGPYSLVLAAWTLVLVYFFVEHVVRLKVYGTFLVPVSALLLITAQLLGANSAAAAALSSAEAQQLESWRVAIHVALILLANAGFAVGGAASALYLLQERQLKHHKVNILFKRLPSLGTTDLLARRAVAWAFPVYAAGLLLGVIRAIETAGQNWWLDPRVMLAGLVFLIFGVYLFLRYERRIPGRNAAWVAIVGFVVVVVLAIAARVVPTGFHVFGRLGG